MRAYGLTNAAPYASAPAVGVSGDSYWNTTEKALYVSDGAAWVKTPSDIDAAKITTGTIASARLPVAPTGLVTANLNDGAVTTAKLAVSATVPAQARTNQNMLGSGSGVTATEVTISQLTGQTYRGGPVLILGNLTANCYLNDDSIVEVRIYLDSTLIGVNAMRGGPITYWHPTAASVAGVSRPAAGSHTVSLRWIRTLGTGFFNLGTADLNALEFG
jgi:hypothetical protein